MIGLRDDPGGAPAPVSHVTALTEKIFADAGVLCSALRLEHRPQQERMAAAVAAAMLADEALIFEAGTGVGKSLAYLIPGIIHAVDTGRQMIVSTHTISLQEQIETKDLPVCRRLFGTDPGFAPYAGFKSALLVGKSNYLCTTRLAQALQGRQELFPSSDQAELQRLAAWARTTREGLRHELNPAPSPDVWEWVNADSSACSRKNCGGGHCFYQRARARLRDAQVIIVNHSLLFTHINAAGASAPGDARGVLFPDDFVVIDEAHTMPEVATEHFGLRLSSYGVERLLKYLYHPQKKRGLLCKLGGVREQQLVGDALEAAEQFFGFLRDRFLDKQPVVRVRENGFCEPWLDVPLLQLILAVEKIADRFDDGRDRDELLEQRRRLKTCQAGLRQFLGVAQEDQVYWLERSGRKGQIVTLRTAPIDVAPHLREALLRRRVAVVMTSATLAIGGQLGPFQQRVGADGGRAEIVASPFDYERHMRVYVAADVPLPSPREAKLSIEALIDYIGFCTLRVPGGSLVLFTSHLDLRQVGDGLRAVYARERRPFFLQGQDFSRTELTRQLHRAGNGILFGTDSFWTGVDVPGDALSQVIITRLPFDPPTHPVAEAKAEWIRDGGGNPFNELTLPDALVKFRQGVGRLIRGKRDRGLVTILDARVLAKSYGRLFLESLPQRTCTRLTKENRDRQFKPFV